MLGIFFAMAQHGNFRLNRISMLENTYEAISGTANKPCGHSHCG
jgi:hypothetical protein